MILRPNTEVLISWMFLSFTYRTIQCLLIEPYKDAFGTSQHVSEERPQDVGRTRLLELNIRLYGDVLITSTGDVLKTSVGDIPWRYIYRTVWGFFQDVTLGHPQDVIFQRPKHVGRGRPQDVGRGRPLASHRGACGTSIGRLLGTSPGRLQDVILPSGIMSFTFKSLLCF